MANRKSGKINNKQVKYIPNVELNKIKSNLISQLSVVVNEYFSQLENPSEAYSGKITF